MKKKLAVLAVSVLVASCLLMSSTVLAGKDGNGNGFPSGPHYNLNILGKNETKWVYNESEEGNNTIFVRLDNKSLILMTPTKGTEFVVEDADAVHKEKGKYDAELLIPYNKSNDYCAYDVYVRARGKPNKNVTISANFTNTTDNTTWYDFGTITLSHTVGKNRLKPGTECINNLFYVTLGDGSTYWLFDHPEYNETVDQYFWNYDNTKGCKLLQVRFYENTSYTPPPDPIT